MFEFKPVPIFKIEYTPFDVGPRALIIINENDCCHDGGILISLEQVAN